ncbi:MAG TPA: sigma-70 family RNA polymerase sigma factor [Bacteroidia bacterium]|jgi:RNA polymerase sigma factor (sigma-70 family)|nr:sigma-70 family RNA polymerase sigma factor [Bacteroidia bacterium]
MIELVKEIRRKNKTAITLLYSQYGKKLYGFAVCKWNLDEDEAWEVIYQTLYKIIEVSDRYIFENENKFVGFIYKVFVNNLRNHYNRKKSRHVETVELNEDHQISPAEEKDGPDNKPVSSIEMNYLQEELQQLEDWKKILLLMRAQDYSYEEIASYIKKPADQLKVYYMRLKNQLTDKINDRINNNR